MSFMFIWFLLKFRNSRADVFSDYLIGFFTEEKTSWSCTDDSSISVTEPRLRQTRRMNSLPRELVSPISVYLAAEMIGFCRETRNCSQ